MTGDGGPKVGIILLYIRDKEPRCDVIAANGHTLQPATALTHIWHGTTVQYGRVEQSRRGFGTSTWAVSCVYIRRYAWTWKVLIVNVHVLPSESRQVDVCTVR